MRTRLPGPLGAPVGPGDLRLRNRDFAPPRKGDRFVRGTNAMRRSRHRDTSASSMVMVGEKGRAKGVGMTMHYGDGTGRRWRLAIVARRLRSAAAVEPPGRSRPHRRRY